VLEHTKKISGKFRAGWPPQRKRYTAEMTARLAPMTASSAPGIDLTDQPAPTGLEPLTTTAMTRTVGTVGTIGTVGLPWANLGE